MIGNRLVDYIEEYGLKKVNNEYAYGMRMGYLITLDEGLGFIRICFSVWLKDAELRESVQEFFDKSFIDDFGIKYYNIKEKMLSVTLKDTIPGTLLVECIESICVKLDDADIHGAEYCDVCDKKFSDDKPECMVLFDRHVMGMHEECLQKIEDKAGVNNSGKGLHVKKGILGAIIGGILGAMPWVAAVFFGYVNIASVTAFFIPLAAQNGYDAFNGRRTKANVWIVAIASFFFVIFMEYYMSVFIGVLSMGGYKPFWEIVKEIIVGKTQTTEAISATISHLVSGWISAGVGSMVALYKTIKVLQTQAKVPKRLD